MCVVSMVHDYYAPKFPTQDEWKKTLDDLQDAARIEKAVGEMRTLIAEFRDLIENAKKIDMKTGQPDCLDPEKGKLEARIKELEAQMPRRRNKVKSGIKAGSYQQLQTPTEVRILDGLGGCDTCFKR